MKKWLERAVLWILTEIAPPIRLLVRGQLRYLVFVVALIIGAWALGAALQSRLHMYIDLLVRDGDLSVRSEWRVRMLCDIAAWIIPYPLIVVAAALPVRLLFSQGRVTIADTLKELPSALRLSIQSTFWGIRSLLIVAGLPTLAIYAVYTVTMKEADSVLARDAFFISAIALIVSILIRGVPVLCSPLLSVVGGYEARYAVYHCQTILRGVRTRLIILFLMASLLVFSLYYYTSLNPQVVNAGICLIGWFFFTLLSHQLVVAAYNHQTSLQQRL